MKRQLSKYLEASKRHIASLTSRMIEIPTVNPPGENYERMACFLEKECKRIGLRVKRYNTPKSILRRYGINRGSKRVSIVADWIVGAKNTLHIASHYDVVPATDKWDTDPFKAVVKGNRIYGRGSEDMKGNIACVLFAMRGLKESGISPKINLQISFTPDEEIGGRTGLGYLVEQGLVRADYAMTEGYSGSAVSIGNKGVLWAEIEVRGKASHASVPHRGVNAFERMNELVLELKKLKKKVIKRRTRYDMEDDVSRGSTFVMGGFLEGGVKSNVVPGTIRFSIDRRLVPEEDAKTAKKEIESVIKRFNRAHRDSRVSVKFSASEDASISSREKYFFEAVSDSIRDVIGKRPRFLLMPGATDIRYFMKKGVPSLGYSAKGGGSWHSDNEFVYIDSLVDTAKVYALIMSRVR